MKKILHIVDSLNMGGAETWLVELVRYYNSLGKNDLQFDFLAAGGTKGIFDDEVLKMGSKIHYLKLDKANIFSFIKGYRQILKTHHYIAIHDHQDFLAGWHFLFGIGLLPKIRPVHFHVTFNQRFKTYGKDKRRKFNFLLGKYLLSKLSTHILGTSGKILEGYSLDIKQFRYQQIMPFHCAINIDKFVGNNIDNHKSVCQEMNWPDETRVILFAGRFDKSTELDNGFNQKNSALAVHILSKVKDEKIRMIMAGANDHILDEFRQLLCDIGLDKRVATPGIRNDIPRLMLASDLFLFPVREEALGLVAVEAQASGLPVLASDTLSDEIVVIKELVSFCSLSEPASVWANKIEQLIVQRKETDTICDTRWNGSDFNLSVSYQNLRNLYGCGE